MTVLVIDTLIGADVEAVFDLSLSVDAHTGSMARAKERAIAGVTSGVLRAGDEVTWQATHFFVPIRMTSAITAYERPLRFVDEQSRGPFLYWHHEHRFEQFGSATRMTDRILFAAPFGIFGRLAERLILNRYMRKLIVQRNQWLKSALEDGQELPD